MTILRALGRVLDPWAAFLLGIMLVLAVMVLLATPGPWQEVVGPAVSVRLASPPPRDVAVFVMGAGDAGTCSAVVWVHVEHERPSVTAVVVPAQLEGMVPGAGYLSLAEIVQVQGPQSACDALARAVHTPMQGWVVLDRVSLAQAVPPMFPTGDDRARRTRYRHAVATWAGEMPPTVAYASQHRLLAAALPRLALDELRVVAFANYLLGAPEVQTNMDLRQATCLADTFASVTPRRMWVRGLPIIRDVVDGDAFWRARSDRVAMLSQSLALGLRPPATPASVRDQAQGRTVMVVAPRGWASAEAYRRAVSRQVRASAGHAVRIVWLTVGPGDARRRLSAALDRERPLALLIACGAAPVGTWGASALEEVITECADVAAARTLPAVVCAPELSTDAAVGEELVEAITISGLPQTPVDLLRDGGTPHPASLARDNVATMVRACRPEVLAPELPGTRLKVSYAERRAANVSIIEAGDTAALLRRLTVCGYQSRTLAADAWEAPVPMVTVGYLPGSRRLALALAGDLGRDARTVAVDPEAPATVAVRDD